MTLAAFVLTLRIRPRGYLRRPNGASSITGAKGASSRGAVSSTQRRFSHPGSRPSLIARSFLQGVGKDTFSTICAASQCGKGRSPRMNGSTDGPVSAGKVDGEMVGGDRSGRRSRVADWVRVAEREGTLGQGAAACDELRAKDAGTGAGVNATLMPTLHR